MIYDYWPSGNLDRDYNMRTLRDYIVYGPPRTAVSPWFSPVNIIKPPIKPYNWEKEVKEFAESLKEKEKEKKLTVPVQITFEDGTMETFEVTDCTSTNSAYYKVLGWLRREGTYRTKNVVDMTTDVKPNFRRI